MLRALALAWLTLAGAVSACGGSSPARGDASADANDAGDASDVLANDVPVSEDRGSGDLASDGLANDVPTSDALASDALAGDAGEGLDGGDAAAVAGRAPAGSPCVPGATYGAPWPSGAAPAPVLVKDGFGFLEGPVWMASQGALFFSDFVTTSADAPGKQLKYTPADGVVVEWQTSTATNGLAAESATTFLGASQQLQRVVRFDVVTKAITNVPGGDVYDGAPFNSLNDLVARADGNIYFTDPTYEVGPRGGQGTAGYYRLSPAGGVTRLGTGTQPNGISLSPDGQWLYVSVAADAGGGVVRHPVRDDGSVGAGAPWSALPSDGMAIDCAGNVYLVAGGAVTVLPPDGGAPIGAITGLPNAPDAFVTNAAFGGSDGRTLFITSSHALYRVALAGPGLPN